MNEPDNELDQEQQQGLRRCVKQYLDQSEQDLQPCVKEQLLEARLQALSQLEPNPSESKTVIRPAYMAGFGMLAASLLLVFSVYYPAQEALLMNPVTEDLELLLSEDPEFYQHMDVLLWADDEQWDMTG